MSWKTISTIIVAFSISACSAQQYYPIYEERSVTLRLVDTFETPHQYGESVCTKDHCVLTIRRDKYPQCFLHEIRHAMEGEFHRASPSSAYCK